MGCSPSKNTHGMAIAAHDHSPDQANLPSNNNTSNKSVPTNFNAHGIIVQDTPSAPTPTRGNTTTSVSSSSPLMMQTWHQRQTQTPSVSAYQSRSTTSTSTSTVTRHVLPSVAPSTPKSVASIKSWNSAGGSSGNSIPEEDEESFASDDGGADDLPMVDPPHRRGGRQRPINTNTNTNNNNHNTNHTLTRPETAQDRHIKLLVADAKIRMLAEREQRQVEAVIDSMIQSQQQQQQSQSTGMTDREDRSTPLRQVLPTRRPLSSSALSGSGSSIQSYEDVGDENDNDEMPAVASRPTSNHFYQPAPGRRRLPLHYNTNHSVPPTATTTTTNNNNNRQLPLQLQQYEHALANFNYHQRQQNQLRGGGGVMTTMDSTDEEDLGAPEPIRRRRRRRPSPRSSRSQSVPETGPSSPTSRFSTLAAAEALSVSGMSQSGMSASSGGSGFARDLSMPDDPMYGPSNGNRRLPMDNLSRMTSSPLSRHFQNQQQQQQQHHHHHHLSMLDRSSRSVRSTASFPRHQFASSQQHQSLVPMRRLSLSSQPTPVQGLYEKLQQSEQLLHQELRRSSFPIPNKLWDLEDFVTHPHNQGRFHVVMYPYHHSQYPNYHHQMMMIHSDRDQQDGHWLRQSGRAMRRPVPVQLLQREMDALQIRYENRNCTMRRMIEPHQLPPFTLRILQQELDIFHGRTANHGHPLQPPDFLPTREQPMDHPLRRRLLEQEQELIDLQLVSPLTATGEVLPPITKNSPSKKLDDKDKTVGDEWTDDLRINDEEDDIVDIQAFFEKNRNTRWFRDMKLWTTSRVEGCNAATRWSRLPNRPSGRAALIKSTDGTLYLSPQLHLQLHTQSPLPSDADVVTPIALDEKEAESAPKGGRDSSPPPPPPSSSSNNTDLTSSHHAAAGMGRLLWLTTQRQRST